MIIAVSDVKEHAPETAQSLVFGSRAILVRTKPTINQFVDVGSLNDEIAMQLQVLPLVMSCQPCHVCCLHAWQVQNEPAHCPLLLLMASISARICH